MMLTLSILIAAELVLLIHPQELINISILVLVPWPDSREYAGWAVGLDLLPGSRIALKEINNDPDLLPGYRINSIEAGHDACGLTEYSLGLTNIIDQAVNPFKPSNVIAVLGLFCSSSTAALSPVAGRAGIDLIQLSASYSPIFKEEIDRFPHLWRFIPAADIYGNIVIHLAGQYGWSKFAIISNTENTFYDGIASSLVTKLQNTGRQVLYDGSLVKRISSFQSQVLSDLITARARIVFISADSAQVTDLLCSARRRNMYYPNYLWIIADWKVEFLLSNLNTSECSEVEFLSILEGSVLLYPHLIPDEASTGDHFRTFEENYWKELNSVRNDYQNTITTLSVSVNGDLQYASVLYNQVYAISYALNDSLLKLKANNIQLEEYKYGQPQVTSIIEESLEKVMFKGFTSYVKFDKYKQVAIPINVYQVIDGNSTVIGIVSKPENITETFGLQFDSRLDDEVPTNYQTIDLALTGIMVMCIILLFLLVTLVMTIVLKYRNVRKIKANSVKVSMLMFVACYAFIVEDILILILCSIELSSRVYGFLCNLNYILMYNAFILLFATQLVKERRIRRIFSKSSLNLQINNWRYSNWMLYLKAIFFCLFGDAILLVTISIDPLSQHFFDSFEGIEAISQYPYCHSSITSHIIFYGLYLYLAVLLIMNIYMATRAKKTMKQHFRNTKFINLCMVAVFITFTLTIPFREVFFNDNKYVLYFNVALFFCTLASATLSQLILFLPVVLYGLKENGFFQFTSTTGSSIQ